MLEANLVEKNKETCFHHGYGNLLISFHRRVNKKPKMLGITVLLVYMLTVQTNFICSDAYIQFFCMQGSKKWATLVPLLLSAISNCKTGKYVTDMYIWLRARKDTFLLF